MKKLHNDQADKFKLSKRLGQLSRDQLQAALDKHNLGDLIDVQPITAGLFGQNAFLTSKSGEWVLRGAPHWPWQFAKERFFLEQLHRSTRAPIPWPYLVEETEDLFGWNYALMPRLPGIPPSDLRDQLRSEDYVEIARMMGDGLAEMHSLTALEPGEYDPTSGGICAEDSFSDWVIRSLNDWQTKTLNVPDALHDRDLNFINEVIKENRQALSVPFQPCFVHYDYKEGNLLVERSKDSWKLSGILDFMTCAYGDGEQDLSRMTASLAFPNQDAARTFITAYRERCPLRPGYKERFRIYMLMDRMILWQYGRQNKIWFPDNAVFRDFAKKFISLDSLLD